MFRVIQLFVFVFVFGRIVHRTICIRPNSLKPLFGASLTFRKAKIGVYYHFGEKQQSYVQQS